MKSSKKSIILFAIIMCFIWCIGCTAKPVENPAPTEAAAKEAGQPQEVSSEVPKEVPKEAPKEKTAPKNPVIMLSTTTSTQDSGLLDYLLPEFSRDTGYEVKVVAVGSGKAIQMGVDGEADVLLVHARADEDKFIAEGHGPKRFDVMYNDFVLVGPIDDKLQLKGKSAKEAFTKISSEKATFISRGDDSGTHKKELNIWKTTGIEPSGEWYVSVGKGMGDTLLMTDEMLGYTLADRATYLSMRDKLELDIVLEGDKDMLNPYGILLVNPEKNNQINAEGAIVFAEWFTSEKGQRLIGQFGVSEFGSPLFTPDAK